MNPMLAAALLGLSASPGAPVPKGPAPNPLSWSYMGVRVQNAVDGNGAPLQISAPDPGTPASKCGLQIGDILVKIGTIEPQTFEDVQRYIFGLRPGTTIAVVVRRGSELKTVKMTLEERPTSPDYQVLPAFIRKGHQPDPDDDN
jgi:S1-C subfamily serine protease